MSTPTPALCGQWEPERRAHCDFAVTHRFLNGWRCALHAPGATDDACPHSVEWVRPCEPCRKLWEPLASSGPVE